MDVIPSPQAGFLHACVIFWKTPRANARVTLSQILSHVFLKASIIISSMWLRWELWACSSRSTRESGPSLSQAPKVKHVHSARPEPRYLVGKVPSVHVFENINKSHRYELIMKSQAAWLTKVGGLPEGWQLDTGPRGWDRKEWLTIPLAGDMNPTLTYSLGAICTHMCIQYCTQCMSEYNDPQRWHRSTYLAPWNVKNRWWLIWNANSWGCLCCIYCCQLAEVLVISHWHQLKHHLI